jgi:hypothetical protein
VNDHDLPTGRPVRDGATGRRVRSFISGIDTNADVACELFVLEPPEESPERLPGSHQ